MPQFPRCDNSVLAVIFDWAGTTVDHGSIAPVEAISQVFAKDGIQLTNDEIRKDMGLHKRDHIRSLLSEPQVREAWCQHHGEYSNEADVERLFETMLEVQTAVLAQHSEVLSGVPDTVEALRKRGIKIGSTTGYAREMMIPLQASAAAQGYSPDCLVCPDDVGGGRPFPWMIYSVCIQLKIYPLWRCVKVGDTLSDMEEGRNAGTWAVGVTKTGNLVGLSEGDWARCTAQDKQQRHFEAERRLKEAGADFVVEDVNALPAVIDAIESQIGYSGTNRRPSTKI